MNIYNRQFVETFRFAALRATAVTYKKGGIAVDKYDFPYRPDMRPGMLPVPADDVPQGRPRSCAPDVVGHRRDNRIAGLVLAAWSVPAVMAVVSSGFKAVAGPPGPQQTIKPAISRSLASGCDVRMETEFIRIQDAMDAKLRAERLAHTK